MKVHDQWCDMRFHDDESARVRIKTAENVGNRGRIWVVFVEIIPYEIRLTFLALLSLRETRNLRMCYSRYTAAEFQSTSLMNENHVAYEDTN